MCAWFRYYLYRNTALNLFILAVSLLWANYFIPFIPSFLPSFLPFIHSNIISFILHSTQLVYHSVGQSTISQSDIQSITQLVSQSTEWAIVALHVYCCYWNLHACICYMNKFVLFLKYQSHYVPSYFD